jgi:hypothetical protein
VREVRDVTERVGDVFERAAVAICVASHVAERVGFKNFLRIWL